MQVAMTMKHSKRITASVPVVVVCMSQRMRIGKFTNSRNSAGLDITS